MIKNNNSMGRFHQRQLNNLTWKTFCDKSYYFRNKYINRCFLTYGLILSANLINLEFSVHFYKENM
jgi:hypothetical protein